MTRLLLTLICIMACTTAQAQQPEHATPLQALRKAKMLHWEGKDKKAARTLKRFAKVQEDATVRHYEQIYRALAKHKIYRWNGQKQAQFTFLLDSVGSGGERSVMPRVQASVNGTPVTLTLDTGAGLNTVTQQQADRLALQRLDVLVPIEGNAATTGQLAMASELHMGSLTMRNVPFVVVPDGPNDGTDTLTTHQQAIVGLPLLRRMKTVEMDFQARHVRTIEPLVGAERNLVADETASILLVRARHHDEEVLLIPDTGATHSALGASFLRAHAPWIAANCAARDVLLVGIGGTIACHEYTWRQFDLRIGSLDHTLPAISIVDADYDNRLGMDFLSKCHRLILDFKQLTLRIY